MFEAFATNSAESAIVEQGLGNRSWTFAVLYHGAAIVTPSFLVYSCNCVADLDRVLSQQLADVTEKGCLTNTILMSDASLMQRTPSNGHPPETAEITRLELVPTEMHFLHLQMF